MCLVSLMHFTQFISKPCYHENNSGLGSEEKPPGPSSKPTVFSSKFHQHVVLCTRGRFNTILIEPRIINKTTSGLTVRKNNQQVIHESRWCFIPNYWLGCFWYHGWLLHNLIQPHLIIKTTSGFRVTKITNR